MEQEEHCVVNKSLWLLDTAPRFVFDACRKQSEVGRFDNTGNTVSICPLQEFDNDAESLVSSLAINYDDDDIDIGELTSSSRKDAQKDRFHGKSQAV